MVAAFSKFTNEVSRQGVEKGLQEIFKGSVLELNKRAVEKVFI